jgi:RND family efflux transporter MFP subunit
MGAPVVPRPNILGFREIALLALVTVYAVTFATLIARLFASLVAVAALRRSCIPVISPVWVQSLDSWRSQLALRSVVQILQGEHASVPVVVGWRCPAIVLPLKMAEATDQQVIDAVLLHELTHIQRGDYAWNLLLRVVRAIYWPHPCVWLVGHFVALDRETVCDAVCVHWLGNVHAYRTILVDVAAALMKRSEIALGMAMASSSKLARRLLRVEQSPAITRGLLARSVRIVVTTAAIISVGLLGSTRLVAGVAVEGNPSDQTKVTTDKGDVVTDDSERAPTQPNDIEPESAARAQLATVDQKPDETSPTVPLRVQTVQVKRGNLEKATLQPFCLHAHGEISIPSRIAGIIARVPVELGDRVKTGELLAELDIPDIRAEVAAKQAVLRETESDQERAKLAVVAAEATVQSQVVAVTAAEAEFKQALASEEFKKKQHHRLQKLFDSKSISEEVLDKKSEELRSAEADSVAASAKVESAKAALARSKVETRLATASVDSAAARVASAQTELNRIVAMTEESARLIRSPIDGVVLEKNIEPGSSIRPSGEKPLFRLTSTNQIAAVVQIPERDALAVKRGDVATLQLDALEGQPAIDAKVSRLAYNLDSRTKTLRVEILLPNSDGRLKPGMYGSVRIVLGQASDALSVPRAALFDVTQGVTEATCVRVVKGRIMRTPVKLGLDAGNEIEVLEGLTSGDVVAFGLQKMPPDGQVVELISPSNDER